MGVRTIDALCVYRRTDRADLLPLVSPTTDVGAASTTITTGVAIGFTFTLDGVDYTTCALSPRGFVRLAGTIDSGDNTALFAASTNVVLAPWWDDMETANTVGYVKHETQGSAPWRRFVVEWYVNLDASYDATNYRRAKMQAVLYETSNRVEYRYGAIESGGSPANVSDASIGLKGDTSGDADNFLDFATNDRDLGGSQTTTTADLDHADWPAGVRILCEPNWPLPSRITDGDDVMLSGIQDRENELQWRFAAMNNWLYCRHCPPLVNLSPKHNGSIAPRFACPVTPSADGLTYRVYVESYSAAGGTFTCAVAPDGAADPQPGTDGDWGTALVTLTETSIAAGLHSWTSATCVIPAATAFLRFKFGGANSIVVMSIFVVPEALSDFDPAATYVSNWVPCGIAQMRQEGAGIHPEFYNRVWKNVAYVLADRRQVVFSFAVPTGDSDYYYSAGLFTVRTLGVSPCTLKDWPAQLAQVEMLIYDDDNNGVAVMRERGGESVTFDVDSNGDEYRLLTGDLQLASEEPAIVFEADPATSIRPACALVTWAPALSVTDYIAGDTPEPRLEYLYALLARLRKALYRGYAMTGLATRLQRGTGNRWRVAWMVPPATKALRPKVARHNSGASGTPNATSIYGASSGAGADDEVVIPSPYASGTEAWPPDGGSVTIAVSSERFDDSPGGASDRMLESPTLGTVTGAVREMVEVTYGVGVTVVPVRDEPSVL